MKRLEFASTVSSAGGAITLPDGAGWAFAGLAADAAGHVIVVWRRAAPPPDAAPRAASIDTAARAALARIAGEAIVATAPVGVWLQRKEVVALGGSNRNAALEAIAKLTRGGVLRYRAGEYALAEGVDAALVAAALSAVGGFTR